MKSGYLIITLIGALGLSTPPVSAAEGSAAPAEGSAAVADGFAQGADETQYHFHLASASYVDNDLRTSAKEIREASESVKKEMSSYEGAVRSALRASIVEMEMLADDVESARVNTVKRLHETFARVEVALAKHHINLAQQAWERKSAPEAGRQLSACARNLGNAVVRTAYEDDAVSQAVERGNVTSRKLLEGSGYSPAEIGKLIAEMSTAIVTFEKSGTHPAK